ncbi:MAG: hypothetical protein J7M14_03495, partial [Planctomycetes bacterium]|nr:hypothetical protein [Planctomycetota bacterium]
RRSRTRKLDLKELIESIAIDDDTLRWTCMPRGDVWARADEVLTLVGLDTQSSLAAVVRRKIEYDI